MRSGQGAVIAAVLGLAGCQSLGYYGQAAVGQSSIIWRSRSIETIVARPDTEPQLAERLLLVQEIRRFAVDYLGLPDSGSYKRYADIGRSAAVWNVFAAPRYGVEAETWCFPVAGCVGYRGYFSRDSAQRFAERLRRQGSDVLVAGVKAYSTLGWFADPVLSTVIADSEAELAALVFHELAHEKIYLKGDTEFNESFATAMEIAGLEAWLRHRGEVAGLDRYRADREFSNRFVERVMRARQDLEALYRRQPGEKAAAEKLRLLDALYADYRALGRQFGVDAGDALPRQSFNNAMVSSVALYHRHVPAFLALWRRSGDLSDFYDGVATLAALQGGERTARLEALAVGG